GRSRLACTQFGERARRSVTRDVRPGPVADGRVTGTATRRATVRSAYAADSVHGVRRPRGPHPPERAERRARRRGGSPEPSSTDRKPARRPRRARRRTGAARAAPRPPPRIPSGRTFARRFGEAVHELLSSTTGGSLTMATKP